MKILFPLSPYVKDRAKAFDSVPILTIKKLKAKWPIKLYCEQILKLTFSRDFKTKCPFHNGDSDTTFVIDPKTGRWTCFGGCEPEPGREFATGDVIDLHQRAFNLPILVEALKSLQALAPNAPRCAQQCSLTQGAHTFFPDPPAKLSRPAKKIDVDSELVRQALERCSHVGRCQLLKRSPISNPTANDFASFLLDSVLQPDDKPIVFVNKKWPIMGAKARKRLTEKPEELQYLCSSISKRALRNKFNPDHGTTRARNLKERIFLDVEFDHEPNLDNQLRLLWWLKAVKGWNLVSITFSGGKSYHGLFHVRGKSDDQIEEMKSLAKSLGACPASLRAHQPVRFPGGTRHDKNGIRKQEIVYLNPKQRCRSFPPAKKGLTTGTTQLDYANQQCQGKFNR